MPEPILHQLDTPPTSSDLYLWCDYVELRCLAHPDHKFSRGMLLEMLQETDDISAEDVDTDDDDDDDDEITDGDGEKSAEGGAVALDGAALKNDKLEVKVADIFKNFAVRAALFADAYPFELDTAGQELSLREFTSEIRQFYLQLLLSSSLRLVPRKRRDELTEPFEALSAVLFQCLMPKWEVHRFGAKGATRYKGHLYKRLCKLAEDLRGVMLVHKDHFKTKNAGDGGLDIVAWHPLGGDGRIGVPIALAQCGCTAEEWSLKSLEASPSGPLHTCMNVHHRWATYYFMPQDLVLARAEGMDWQRRPRLTESIVLDRLRLVRLASEYGVAAQCVNAPALVGEAAALAVA